MVMSALILMAHKYSAFQNVYIQWANCCWQVSVSFFFFIHWSYWSGWRLLRWTLRLCHWRNVIGSCSHDRRWAITANRTYEEERCVFVVWIIKASCDRHVTKEEMFIFFVMSESRSRKPITCRKWSGLVSITAAALPCHFLFKQEDLNILSPQRRCVPHPVCLSVTSKYLNTRLL